MSTITLMSRIFSKHTSLICICILLIVLVPLYMYKLGTIPTNISGDETTYLGVVYRILFGNRFVNPFYLVEDYTKTALAFYWMALIIKIVGIHHAVFGMRVAMTIPAIGLLIVFFILLKQKTTYVISFFMTLLLGTNILFLNFARSGWLNLSAVFFGTLSIFFLQKGLSTYKIRFYIFAGLSSSFACYWYLSGYIYPISMLLFLVILILSTRVKKKRLLKNLFIFSVTVFIILFPIMVMGYFQRNVSMARPSAVFIFHHTKQSIPQVLWQQTIDVGKGVIFFNSDVIGKGFENPRYFPIQTSLVDPIIRLLFLTGLLYYFYIFIRKPFVNIWMIIFLVTFLTVGILTVDAPNLARMIPILPCIYLLTGNYSFVLFKAMNKKMPTYLLLCSIAWLSLVIAFTNTRIYFSWAQSHTNSVDRHPAIEYSEFEDWQSFQIDRVKSGYLPIINQQWYNIRKSLKD